MSSAPWLALIALDEPRLPDPDAVADSLHRTGGGSDRLVPSSRTDAMATFSWGDATIAYNLIDRPIPAGQLEGPCACAWYWPDAAVAMSRHQAHLIVALVDDERDQLAICMKLTQFVAALLPHAAAVGLQWGGSRQVHQPGAFCELAATMSRENLPLHLWIDYRIEQDGAGGLRLFTTGLSAFGRRELEVATFSGEPQELMNHAYNIAHYLIDKRAVLRDGETIGLPGDVQVIIHEARSFLDGEMEVLRLDFDPGEAAGPPSN